MHKYLFPVNSQDTNTTYGFVFSRLTPPSRILDVGAGPGLLSAALKDRGFEVLAVDRDPEAIEVLKEKKIPYRLMDIDDPDFSKVLEDRYDTVMLCDVIEHLPQPEKLFEILADNQQNFERILITIPNISHLGIILGLIQDRFNYTQTGLLDSTHLRFFTRESFLRMVEQYGFRVVEYHPITLELPSPEFTLSPKLPLGDRFVQEILEQNPNALTYQHCFELRYAPDEPCSCFAPKQADLLSVVIRTIDGRLSFLDKTLFSLFTQSHDSIEAIIVYQGTKEDSLSEIGRLSERYRDAGLEVRLLQNPTDEDERTKNLNLGIQASQGQYIAFLDDDDLIYPDHYEGMIESLKNTHHAWAYADVCRAEGETDSLNEFHILRRNYPFKRDGYRYLDHWNGNFIPIHSFLVDLFRIPEGFLRFDERLIRHEDYDMLLRLASNFPPFYRPKVTCEYRIRTDGSNSVFDGTSDDETWREKLFIWEQANALLDLKKRQLRPAAWMPMMWSLVQEVIEERDRFREELSSFRNAKRFVMVEKINNYIKRTPHLHAFLKFSMLGGWRFLKRLRRK